MITSPIEVGNQYILDIRKQGINGEGIAYFNKLAIFIPGAILKEEINCEIVELHQTYALGKIIEIIRPSTKRAEPPCKFYDRCGGCQMQHIEYKEQLKIKQSILKQSLSRYTDLNLNLLDIRKTMGMGYTFHYRNKSQMPFKNTNFGLAMGLYAPGSNHFVYVDECIVQDKSVNEVNQETLSLLRKHNVFANDSLNPEGILLNLVTRYIEESNSVSVTFIVTKYEPILKAVAHDLVKRKPIVQSVTYSVNMKSNPLMFGKTVELLAKKGYIVDRFQGLEIKISPDAFHQLNSTQMRLLYKEVIKAAALTGKEVVIDAYSGIGITSLLMARNAKKVYGIDYSHQSTLDAIDNAEKNNIKNVEFMEDHVERALPKIINGGVRPNLILLDPPRAGLADSVLKLLVETQIKKMIYVSCNPSTLAKNLNVLLSQYRIVFIQPVDMFPHTSGVESITVLEHK